MGDEEWVGGAQREVSKREWKNFETHQPSTWDVKGWMYKYSSEGPTWKGFTTTQGYWHESTCFRVHIQETHKVPQVGCWKTKPWTTRTKEGTFRNHAAQTITQTHGKVRGDHVHEETYPTSYTVFRKLKEFPQKYQKTVWSPSVSCTVWVTFQKLLDAQVRGKI